MTGPSRSIGRAVLAGALLLGLGTACKLAPSERERADAETPPREAATMPDNDVAAAAQPAEAGETTAAPSPEPDLSVLAATRSFAADLELLCRAGDGGGADLVGGLDWSFIESSSAEMLGLLKTLGANPPDTHCGLVLAAVAGTEVESLRCPALCPGDALIRQIDPGALAIDSLPPTRSPRLARTGPRVIAAIDAERDLSLFGPDGELATPATASSDGPLVDRAARLAALTGELTHLRELGARSVLVIAPGGAPMRRLGIVVEAATAASLPLELLAVPEAEDWRTSPRVIGLNDSALRAATATPAGDAVPTLRLDPGGAVLVSVRVDGAAARAPRAEATPSAALPVPGAPDGAGAPTDPTAPADPTVTAATTVAVQGDEVPLRCPSTPCAVDGYPWHAVYLAAAQSPGDTLALEVDGDVSVEVVAAALDALRLFRRSDETGEVLDATALSGPDAAARFASAAPAERLDPISGEMAVVPLKPAVALRVLADTAQAGAAAKPSPDDAAQDSEPSGDAAPPPAGAPEGGATGDAPPGAAASPPVAEPESESDPSAPSE